MTFSDQERLENRRLAFELMLEELGELQFNGLLFEIRKPPYEGVIYATTWEDLKYHVWVEDTSTMDDPLVALTAGGWIQAIHMLKIVDSPTFQDQVGRLMAVMKKRVDDRREMGFEEIGTLAGEARLSEGFVFNIVETGYIDYFLKRVGSVWAEPGRGQLVKIPANFGSKIITEY